MSSFPFQLWYALTRRAKMEPEYVAAAFPTGNLGTESILEIIKRFKDINVYGFLLNPDRDHPLAEVIRERWTEIHYHTGEKVLIFATEGPRNWSKNLKKYWEKELGDKFEETWQAWQEDPDAGSAFQYMGLFEPPLDQSQLPCLVLFTDPKERKAVVRSLPDWDADSLYHLLRNLVGVILTCAQEPDKGERLECLERELTSPSKVVLANLDYMKDIAWDYVKKHPAKVLAVIVGFVTTLLKGNVIALSPTAITVLKAIKDAALHSRSLIRPGEWIA